MKKTVVLLANGFEEIEALSPADYLRRAGAEVIIAATGTSSRNVACRLLFGVGMNVVGA